MRRTIRRLASLFAITAIATALSAGTAAAAPVNAPNAQVVALDCGDAGTFDAVVNGSGEWSPGHLLDGQGVVIPVAFGEETVTVRDAEGTIVDEFTNPAITKGNGKARARARNRTPVQCTYSLSFTDDGTTITVTGSATGFLTGRPAAG